jgi:hypothetical protein
MAHNFIRSSLDAATLGSARQDHEEQKRRRPNRPADESQLCTAAIHGVEQKRTATEEAGHATRHTGRSFEPLSAISGGSLDS